MHQRIRLSLVTGLWLLVSALPAPAVAAGIEASIEVTECFSPLNQDSVCQLRAFWTGGSGKLQEVTILEAVKQNARPSRNDFRGTFRAQGDELTAPSPDGFRRTRKTSEFGSWLFEGKQPWTYCVMARVRDDAGARSESQPTCLDGNP